MAGRIKRMVMLRWCLGILAVLIGTSAHAEKISEITIEGLRRIDKEGVLGIIGSKVGGELSAEQVTKDIETIWAKNFFRDIQVYQEETPDGVRLVWVIEKSQASVASATKELTALARAMSLTLWMLKSE